MVWNCGIGGEGMREKMRERTHLIGVEGESAVLL